MNDKPVTLSHLKVSDHSTVVVKNAAPGTTISNSEVTNKSSFHYDGSKVVKSEAAKKKFPWGTFWTALGSIAAVAAVVVAIIALS